MIEIQKTVEKEFSVFGKISLKERLQDINRECGELFNAQTVIDIKEELGDLVSSCFQLANECGWEIDDLITATLEKIRRRKEQYSKSGSKTKVAIYGGCFDPPHLGHFSLADSALDSGLVDEVWFLPCYNSLYGKTLSDPKHRLKMLEMMVKYNPNMKVCDYEIVNKFNGSTHFFLKKFLNDEEFTDKYDFYFLAAGDTAIKMKYWPKFEDIISMAKFIVAFRPGYDIKDFKVEDMWFINSSRHNLLEIKTPVNISSSQLRQSFKDKTSAVLMHNMYVEIYRYIIDNRLYI